MATKNYALPSNDGTSGQVLTSNGTDVLPSYQAAASGSIGGSITSGTVGSVLFIGTGPVLAQNNTKVFWDNSAERLLIGANTTVGAAEQIGISSATQASFAMISTSATAGTAPMVGMYRARGTLASPTVVQSGDKLGTLNIGGQGNAVVGEVADSVSIRGVATQTWSTNNYGAKLVIGTTANNAAAQSDRVTIDQDGSVGIGVTSPTVRLSVATGTVSSSASSFSNVVAFMSDSPGTGATAAFFGSDATVGGPSFNGLKSRGTNAAPTDSSANDTLFSFSGYGYESGYKQGVTAVIKQGSGTGSTNRLPGYMTFNTKFDSGTDSILESMRIAQTGNVTIGSTTSTSMFNVGSSAQFQVNSSGAIAKLNNVTPPASAALTNNVTSGGTSDTIADFTDLTIYANDAATIRNNMYQMARKIKELSDALRAYGLLT